MIKCVIVLLLNLLIFSCERNNYIDVQRRDSEFQHLNYILDKSENEMIQYKPKIKLDNENKKIVYEKVKDTKVNTTVKQPVKTEVKQEVTFWKPDCNPLWTFDDDNCINQCYPLFNCY